MDYPKPLIIPPLQPPHKQTIILLHGRGSWADKFGPALLETPIVQPLSLVANNPTSDESPANIDAEVSASPSADSSNSTPTSPLTLMKVFPHARFVFPTAARSRATIYKRAYTRQWFNNWKLDPSCMTDREELQIDGLRETTAYLHKLLREEIDLVPGGAENVVLGGLSQGCAAMLTALLLWEGERLAAAVGMSGWLPFAERLLEQIEGADIELEGGGNAECETEDAAKDFDPFARDDGSELGAELVSEPAVTALGWLREELQIERSPLSDGAFTFQDIPIFLGHGVEDDTVNIILGQRASGLLRGIGGEVCWKEYEGLGHWYSAQMLRDLVNFIHEETGWKTT